MKKRYGIMLAVFWYILFFSSVEGRGADWKVYSTLDDGIFYYDAESITRLSKDVVRVWDKTVYNKEGVNDIVAKMGDRFKTLSESIQLTELQCAEKKWRVLAAAAYSSGGEVLISRDSIESEWKSITPESVTESLHKILCK